MPGLSPYNRVLQVGQREKINARGSTVFLRQATGEIRVTCRSQQVGVAGGEAYTLRMTAAEKWFHADVFDQIEIENTAGVVNTIELYIGYGDFEKPVPDIVNVQVSSPASATVESFPDETNIDAGAAGAVELLPANPQRINAWVTALDSNSEAIRVGDANVDSNQGTQLQPGDTILWSSKAACWACSETAADQGAAIVEFAI